ncbi:MAG: ACP phosphodiesterase [Bacteroidales bacterium]|nr:ACP phosphodiesterase [Bacteroidales bacterium]MCF8387014.1 ACP phosphodiesterase [Bacteroidales bacterium]MCF8397363.1 ACP phosphodiesterase [Bacteroidales bacterium]
MNFLAHLYLSPQNEKIMLGNFFADAVKGKAFNKFEADIRRGIILHRNIDDYTDHHPVFVRSAKLLQPNYRKYSKVIVDIYYDHFLARYWNDYSERDITDFVLYVYRLLARNYSLLPARSRRILPFMIAQNWLAGYANLKDMERVFRGMSRRTGYKSGMEYAVVDLKKHYDFFLNDFREFFPELIRFVKHLKY